MYQNCLSISSEDLFNCTTCQLVPSRKSQAKKTNWTPENVCKLWFGCLIKLCSADSTKTCVLSWACAICVFEEKIELGYETSQFRLNPIIDLIKISKFKFAIFWSGDTTTFLAFPRRNLWNAAMRELQMKWQNNRVYINTCAVCRTDREC